MTIAACYVSPEGVVLGADSTSTYLGNGVPHYYNHAQKLFEIGDDSTLGIVTWGLGGLALNSYRTMLALLADDIRANPPTDVAEIASRWADRLWQSYSQFDAYTHFQGLHIRPAFGSGHPDERTEDEEQIYSSLRSDLVAGFCLAGYLPDNRQPSAYCIIADPTLTSATVTPLTGHVDFWGAPNVIQRIILGCDENLQQKILTSGHWTGTLADLQQLIADQVLAHPPVIPIRDAIDFVYSSIASTIKGLKFSSLSQTCGGPIEIAVITTDRKFRWVRHKQWDAAINDGDP